MKSLPHNVRCYKRTPSFTEASLPDGLRKDHATKVGVWGLIHIESGRLLYEIISPAQSTELNVGDQHGVIEPEILHRVAAIGQVKFYVEFYR